MSSAVSSTCPIALGVPAERRAVGLREQQLPDGGRGLLRGEVARAPGQPQRGQPGRDRPRRHQHHLGSRAAPRRQRVDQRVEPLRVEPAVEAGERRRAHLDDEAAGRGELLAGVHGVLLPTGPSTVAVLR